MRIIHGKGYSHDEKMSYIGVIFQNINAAVKILIRAMETLGKNKQVISQNSANFLTETTMACMAQLD